MGKIKSFKDLIVWQRAYELAGAIYRHTSSFPDKEKFGLTSQICRSSVSVGSNIVEGFARKGVRDALRFYNIANASLEEMKFQLMLSRDLGYLTDLQFNELWSLSEETGRLLSGWIRSQS